MKIEERINCLRQEIQNVNQTSLGTIFRQNFIESTRKKISEAEYKLKFVESALTDLDHNLCNFYNN